MTIGGYEFLMTSLAVFAALMILARFAFYRRHDRGMAPVYFWGGCLFLVLTASNIGSYLFYGAELHKLQTGLLLGLTAVTMYYANKQRAVIPA